MSTSVNGLPTHKSKPVKPSVAKHAHPPQQQQAINRAKLKDESRQRLLEAKQAALEARRKQGPQADDVHFIGL